MASAASNGSERVRKRAVIYPGLRIIYIPDIIETRFRFDSYFFFHYSFNFYLHK